MNHPTRALPATLKALSLAVASTLLMQGHALAVASNAELNSIKLYGDVTIAQDSPEQWGPWTQFEAPAAGPGPLVLQKFNPELFRTLPVVAGQAPVVVPELPKDLTGFGVFWNLNTQTEDSDGPHSLSLTGSSVTPSSTGSVFPDAMRTLTTPLSTGSYLQVDSGTLTLQEGGYSRDDGQGKITTLALIATDPADAEATQVSYYMKTISTYISSPDERAPMTSNEFGVIGKLTPESDMARLANSVDVRDFQATYQGNSLLNNASVILDVNFKTAQWSGSWNGGTGNMGFDAVGSISGAQFSSTSVSTRDETSISGIVKGGFFGPNAGAAAGVSDITKGGVRTVDPFITYKQPTNVQEARVQAK
jgi:hypothetical protein